MRIVVIGGTGLIGSKLVTKLREQGQLGETHFEDWLSQAVSPR